MKRLIGAVIIVTLAIAGGRLAFMKITDLAWFRLGEIKVACPDNLEKDEVIKASMLKTGQSIFKQNLETAGAELLHLPGVEAVTVSRKLPSSMAIDLAPEETVLFVKADKIMGLTRALKLIKVETGDRILPVVTGVSGMARSNSTDRLKLGYALAIHDDLLSLSPNLAGRLAEIHCTKVTRGGAAGLIELYFDPGGVRVLISLRNYKEALQRIVVLDNAGMLGNSGYFDMTAGRMVIKGGI